METKQEACEPNFIPSPALAEALQFAVEVHGTQVRKGTRIPYVSHLLGVASLVIEHGGDEQQAIAGLLHDAIEDSKAEDRPRVEADILKKFGPRVAGIVHGCTDGVPDARGKKTKWRVRKERYLTHLKTASEDVLLVSACDKLHNARAIGTDLESLGEVVFERFKGRREGTLWYYNELAELFLLRLPGSVLARELNSSVERTGQQVAGLDRMNVRVMP